MPLAKIITGSTLAAFIAIIASVAAQKAEHAIHTLATYTGALYQTLVLGQFVGYIIVLVGCAALLLAIVTQRHARQRSHLIWLGAIALAGFFFEDAMGMFAGDVGGMKDLTEYGMRLAVILVFLHARDLWLHTPSKLA